MKSEIRPARMRDVANLAGVSVMTVSRAMNGSAAVADDLRKRVLEAIERLDYRRNEVARSLRAQRSRQIGLIVPNLVDPFFAICANAVSVVAKKHQYSVLITTSDENPDIECEQISLMVQRNVEGIVLVPARRIREAFSPTLVSSLPVVTLDRPLKASCYASVVVENKDGARLGVEHLIQHGYRRIVHLCLDRRLYTLGTRDRGYHQAMKHARLTPEVINGDYSDSEMVKVVRELRTQGSFALFCSNNLMTRRALHALSQLNLRIPQDVPLVGFDDFETADLLTPSVTIVRQPIHELGSMGAEILFKHLETRAPQNERGLIVLPVELIIRESCGSHRKR